MASHCENALGIEYRASSLTLGDGVAAGVHAGDRAPDALVNVVSGPGGRTGQSHVFELLDPSKFTLLLFDRDVPGDATDSNRVGAAFQQALPQALNVWRATDAMAGSLIERYGAKRATDAMAGSLIERYGAERPSFCLIRPDGYVMLRGTPAEADKALAFCQQFFSGPSH